MVSLGTAGLHPPLFVYISTFTSDSLIYSMCNDPDRKADIGWPDFVKPPRISEGLEVCEDISAAHNLTHVGTNVTSPPLSS